MHFIAAAPSLRRFFHLMQSNLNFMLITTKTRKILTYTPNMILDQGKKRESSSQTSDVFSSPNENGY